jgi:hypothetical protein
MPQPVMKRFRNIYGGPNCHDMIMSLMTVGRNIFEKVSFEAGC